MRRLFTKRRLLATFGALSLLALVFTTRRIELNNSVDTLLDESRREGAWYPMSELDSAYPPVPDQENAALLFLAAADAIQRYDPDDGDPAKRYWTPWFMRPIDGEDELRLVRNFLKNNQEALQLAYQALERPRSRYPISIQESFSKPLYLGRSLFPVRDLLVADARYRASQGDSKGFARSLLTLVRLGDSFHGLPLSFQGWAFHQIHSYVGWFLTETWNSSLGPAEYQYMAAYMDRFETPSAVAGVAAVLGSAAYDHAEQVRRTPALRGQDLTEFEYYIYVERPWIGHVVVLGFQLTGAHDTQRLAELKALRDLRRSLTASPESTRLRDPLLLLAQQGDMSETFVVALSKSIRHVNVHVQAEDYRRIARTRLACELYRAEFGRYPRGFAELVPRFMEEMPKQRWHIYDGALQGTGLSWNRR